MIPRFFLVILVILKREKATPSLSLGLQGLQGKNKGSQAGLQGITGDHRGLHENPRKRKEFRPRERWRRSGGGGVQREGCRRDHAPGWLARPVSEAARARACLGEARRGAAWLQRRLRPFRRPRGHRASARADGPRARPRWKKRRPGDRYRAVRKKSRRLTFRGAWKQRRRVGVPEHGPPPDAPEKRAQEAEENEEKYEAEEEGACKISDVEKVQKRRHTLH